MACRRLYFGGSFNPIHLGHLICARAAAEAGGFDQIVLVPAGQPPHKPADPEMASPTDRLEMCRLAVLDDPLFDVSDIELNRSGLSYTIDTIRQLHQPGGEKVAWLIGADMARFLPHWHDSASLLAEAQFVLLARPGWSFDWQTLPMQFQHLQKQVVLAPLIDISSTDIRRRRASGQSIRYLTPLAVENYISTRPLYGR